MLLVVRILLLLVVGLHAEPWQLDYLFPSMIFEAALRLTPPFQANIYAYSFVVPPPSKLYGPNVAFYLFAGQPKSSTALIVINQDGRFLQTLSAKQYWQSQKVPIPLSVNQTKVELYIQDGETVGPRYTIQAVRATE